MSSQESHDRRLDELVAAVTPRVLDEALEQAVARARDELADRLARAIVERAVAAGCTSAAATGAAAQPAPARDPVPAAVTGSSDVGLYAFAIIPARPVDLAGVAGIDGRAPLHIVQHGDLGLVVSSMRLDLMDDVSEDDLSETGPLATLARRHDEVVRSVFEHGAVLPLRFGTVVADEDGARRLLAQHAPEARRRLAHVDTHREWGVRLIRDASARPADDVAARDERHAMTGTSYLASRRKALQESQEAEQQTAALTVRVEEALGEHAVDVAHRGGSGSGLLADLAYLVPVAGEDLFLGAAERVASEVAHDGLTLEVTGPWPPYSFAGLQSGHPGTGVAGHA